MQEVSFEKKNKSKKLVIFGNSHFAKLMSYYFEKESEYEVCAFTVDDDYCNTSYFQDKVLIPFSELQEKYSSSEYELFIAIGYQSLNKLRESIFQRVKALGYTCANYISKHAVIENEYKIGTNCAIFAGAILGAFTELGDNNIVFSQSVIEHDCVIGSHNYFAVGVVFGGFCEIGNSNFIGNNATIRDKIKIGNSCLIGMGAVITKNIHDKSFIKVMQTHKQETTTDELFKNKYSI